MIKINCSVRRLRNFSFSILVIVFTISNSYSDYGFKWFGRENSTYQTTKVYLKDGIVLSGLTRLRLKTKRLIIPHTSYPPQTGTTPNYSSVPVITTRNLTLINIEGRKIRPFETDSIIINSLTGIPYDSLWLFKIIDGKISAFNTRPLWRSSKFTHIQKDGSDIRIYSRELLKEYLKDNEYALSLFTTYRDSKSKVLLDYHPRRAILEYNFQTSTKRRKVYNLLQLLKREENIEQKVSYCKEIISIDSSISEPYIVLGDYAVEKNNTEEAYAHYTNCLRYCNNIMKIRKVREKIKNLQKIPIY